MMKKIKFAYPVAVLIIMAISLAGFNQPKDLSAPSYKQLYQDRLGQLQSSILKSLEIIKKSDPRNPEKNQQILKSIHSSRLQLKSCDFWLRYLDPIAYRKINGPLPVEWENEVFEKFEAPYKREGAGLILAENKLGEESLQKTDLIALLDSALASIPSFLTDSMIAEVNNPANFYFANRLFLLNLTAIYTTGFECPDSAQIIVELKHLLNETAKIYNKFYHDLPILTAATDTEKNFRVNLSAQTGMVIKKAMKLLGIEVPEKM